MKRRRLQSRSSRANPTVQNETGARLDLGGGFPMTLPAMIKQPSAFLPLAMSLAALATVLLHLARFGVVREPDEGAAAHIWQLLMAAQIPIIGFFAIKWLPRA